MHSSQKSQQANGKYDEDQDAMKLSCLVTSSAYKNQIFGITLVVSFLNRGICFVIMCRFNLMCTTQYHIEKLNQPIYTFYQISMILEKILS